MEPAWVSVAVRMRTRGKSYQDLLRVADSPREVSYCAISLHDLWCELDAEPGK